MAPEKPRARLFATFDIGGTTIKYGVIQEDATLIWSKELPTQSKKGGLNIIKTVCNLVNNLEEKPKLSGICISTAGMVDPQKGVIVHSASLIPNYAGMCVKDYIEAACHLPCAVENDVNCAALAEATFGAAKGAQSAVMLTIGTGIGGALLLNGQVLHGASDSAGEVGYMHMGQGAFQELAATSVLVEEVAREKHDAPKSWDGKAVFSAAKDGDAICKAAIEKMVMHLSKGIAIICYVFNPEVVVLGGGVMSQKDYLEDKLRTSLKTYLVPYMYEHTRLTFATFQNEAGMIGALVHFLK